MEHLFYLIVRLLITAYMLYSLFVFLFGINKDNLWRLLTPRNTVKNNLPVIEPEPEITPYNIVGKSQTVYLEKPPEKKAIEPVISEDLEKETPYEEEPDTIDDEVDYISENLPAKDILSEEERFMSFDSLPEDGESTGMTFEQISMAMDVVQGKSTDDDSHKEVARIMQEIGECDLFNFLTAQAENEILIERLMKENIDNDGLSAPENIGKKRRKVEEFDMEKYV